VFGMHGPKLNVILVMRSVHGIRYTRTEAAVYLKSTASTYVPGARPQLSVRKIPCNIAEPVSLPISLSYRGFQFCRSYLPAAPHHARRLATGAVSF
jgi:hypothetical protein